MAGFAPSTEANERIGIPTVAAARHLDMSSVAPASRADMKYVDLAAIRLDEGIGATLLKCTFKAPLA